jgi:hypothetical protein
VILDVCKAHGTWFDAGELTRVVAFAGAGGFERTRARERLERLETREPKSLPSDVAIQLTIMAGDEQRASARIERWRDLLFDVFRW